MGPDKAQVTFLDVSAYFSEEEWKLLQEWQKDLYSNVMKEIHQALISLGPIITNSVVSKRAREKQEVYPLDNQESAQGVSATDTILSVSVKEETEPYCMDHENTEYISNPSGHDDENMSFLIKDEEEAYSIDQQESSCATTGYENISFSEKDEEDAYSIHHQGNPRKRSLRVPSGNGSMTRQSQTGEMMQCMKINEQCKDSMEGKLSAVHQSFYRRTDSSSVLQSESFPEMSGEIASQCNSSFSNSENFHLHKAQNQARMVQKYDEGHHSWNISEFRDGVMNIHHNQTHKCTECDQSFHLKGELIRHMGTHSGVRPFACIYCEKSFFQKIQLIRHYRTHKGEKTYICTLCHKRFNQKDCLNAHIRMHTGERP